ncbi:hypothetical protein SUGI_0811390 [Cryptomeria japonica]|nr:hypothetical protein SUGI_0811390 [Cryptomeria japonica]
MQQLRRLRLWGNQFVSGSSDLPILRALTNCSSLEILELGFYHLTGVLPTLVGHLSNSLSILALNSNEIGGSIPNEIGNLTNLRDLALSVNRFNGTIPSALGKLPNLERLYLKSNNLQGRIPKSFGQSKRLGYLTPSKNMLSGQIPDSLGELPQLRELFLYRNQLSGKMPASLGKCKTLERVAFSHNKLITDIPPEVVGLQNIKFFFNVSNNFLQGSILEMSKMVMVLAIDLSQNNLSGVIPSALASCKCLEYLTLSSNAFEGPIPASLADLQNLQYMDLSRNNLSGMILVTFKKMKMLRHLNLSSNKLTGEVPKEGAFATLDVSEVMGNLGLCGGWINLPPCSHSNHKQPSVSKKRMQCIKESSTSQYGGRCRLNLSDRIRIAMEIAEGMKYLHHYCFVQVIHCDLKPNNVLLGDDMTSYIADFGLSNIIFGNSMDSLISTDALKGFVGYIAPEYGIGGKLTTKGDVYSYGILILELLTRRRPTDDMFTKGINLQKWIEMHSPNRISDVVDNCLLNAHESGTSMVIECLTQFIHIGLFCTRESPQERPDMTEIVDRLNTIRGAFLGTPKTPQLPIDISPFLDNTRGINMAGSGNDEGSSTSTS